MEVIDLVAIFTVNLMLK